MTSPNIPTRMIELIVGLATLVLSTVAFLLSAPALGVIALVTGGVSFGILLGSRPA